MSGVRNVLRLLVFVLVRGARPDTPAAPRFRLVIASLLVVPVVFMSSAHIGWPGAVTFGYPVLFAGLATAVPLVVALRHPLVAWRLVALLLAVTPLVYRPYTNLVDWWGWPWTMGLLLITGLVLYVLAEDYPRPVLIVVWALTAAAMSLHLPDPRDTALISAGMAVVLVLGNAVRLRRQAERRRLEEEGRSAALEERTRIARELHDVVTHHMAVLALRADSASFRLPGLEPEVLAEFALLQKIARDGMTEMRRMLGALRAEDDAAGTTPQPELRGVEDVVERLRATGTEIALNARYGEVPAGVGLSAYRIVQEALSNSARHAPGAAITVDISVEDDRLRISVRNAAGMRSSTETDEDRPRHGLVGMRERARMLGGTLTAEPTADGGFAVEAALPLDGGERQA